MTGWSHPILSCADAAALERRILGGDEQKEWAAMQAAGRATAAGIIRDAQEIGGLRPNCRVLVLVGKGHNGGDALIATQAILEKNPTATADVLFVFGERSLRPLAMRAWQSGCGFQPQRMSSILRLEAAARYDLCVDGVFGFQFRPPAEPRVKALFEQVNALPIRFRAAVDLPSANLFRADFTYATGSVKTPVVDADAAGRVRYIDLGFFDGDVTGKSREAGSAKPRTTRAEERVVTADVLEPIAALRPARSDKRKFGHVFIIGGSRGFPGAVLMTVLSALRSGAGLVTAFVPESLAASFASRAPEAMWVGWPETPSGGLALEGEHLLRARFDRANALVIGPGLGREPETLALVQSIVASSPIPVVLDADAQQPEIVRAGQAPRIVTPHAGEFKRIAGDQSLRDFAAEIPGVVVLKGPVTRICGGDGIVYHNFFGGPVLARGGSGDLLAGMIGALLAHNPQEPLLAAVRGVVWHGLAADALARAHGQVAVHTTQLLDFLGPVLSEL